MTVISESPLCLKIHLSRLEMKKYFTSYENIIFNNPKVKETIYFLLDAASNGLDFEKNGKLLVEVFPTASGGCILKFTSEPDINYFQNANIKQTRLKSKNETYIFRFENFENLLDFVNAYSKKENAAVIKSGIYLLNNKYYLIIKLPLNNTNIAMLLNEYASFSARGANISEAIKEHGKCIIRTNAIEKLAILFFKQKSN